MWSGMLIKSANWANDWKWLNKCDVIECGIMNIMSGWNSSNFTWYIVLFFLQSCLGLGWKESEKRISKHL